jgi:ABC-type transport system substrate-binding protein
MISRWMSRLSGALAGAAALATVAAVPVQAQGHLRLGMTANDVPLTWGQPDNGFEGFRFVGLQIYDALINFDLTQADKPSNLIAGLAESWEVNKADPTKWTFKLRRGVKFHDGSEFNADAVIFNMDRLYDEKAPQYSARMGVAVELPHALIQVRSQDRRLHGRIRDEGAGLVLAVPDLLRADGLSQGLGGGRQELGGVREETLRHRPLAPHRTARP